MKADRGTPETQLKRLAMVLNPKTGEIGDPKYAETAVGQMCEQGWLHPEITQARKMADAAHTFLQIWRAVFPERSACNLSQFQPSSNGEIDLERASADLRSLRAHLKDKALYEALIDSCVYNKWPRQTTYKYSDSFIALRTGLMRVMEWQRNR